LAGDCQTGHREQELKVKCNLSPDATPRRPELLVRYGQVGGKEFTGNSEPSQMIG